jgi:molecular chaperone GrpE (heat shock protein)
MEKTESISKVLVNSGWQYSDSLAGTNQRIGQRKRIPLKSRARIGNKNGESSEKHFGTKLSQQDKENVKPPVKEDKLKSKDKTASETILSESSKKINPIDDTLKDLTQQVSAIREYAANQQNRLEKLQDGYDWNIIKNFCLRIIRCIDNIESRIEQLAEQEGDVLYLEEIRDELIFALESSGVEQYEPEIDSEYRGQEKFAEAVKEKAKCDDPEQRGRIEKVIRPGYQCFIDEENVRIVRPAQVRLYA